MKRKKLLIALLTFGSAATLYGCSGNVPKSDYDKLKTENASLQKSYDDLKSDYDSMISSYTLLFEEKANNMTNDRILEYGTAWATTAFGENIFCTVSDNNLNVNVYSGIPISSESVSQIVKQFISSCALYSSTYEMSPDSLPFNLVSINFYDDSNNGIVALSFKYDGSDPIIKDIMCNINYYDIIAAGISNGLTSQ